jgi:hypothetical protein
MTTATNGAAIEVRHPTAAMTPFAPQGLEQAMTLAQTLAQSGLMPNSLRGKPQDVLVVLITGHELGLSPMQAVRSVHVVQGRAVMSADLMVALAVRSSTCEYFRLVSSDDKGSVYETKRRGAPEPVRMAFTMEQAKAAGLTGKDNWKNYPAAMLRARCSAALVRAVYPDLALGVYEESEADEIPASAPARTVAPPPPPSPSGAAAVTLDAEIVPSPEPEADPAPKTEDAPQADPSDPLAGLRAALAAAATRADLNKVLKQIREVPADLKAEAAALYNARAKEIGNG